MTDIFIKSPDPRPSRWWRIPSPTKEYKENYDRIFRKKKKRTKGAAKKPKK